MDSSAMDTRPVDRSRKRQRSAESPSSESSPDLLQPDWMTPFTCTHKIKNMDPDQLETYFPNLPERSQYLDMGKLIQAKLECEAYYANELRTWRAIRTLSDVVVKFYDDPPDSIKKKGIPPPSSTFEVMLRASVTYNTLLNRFFRRREIDERIARLTLITARKTLDYLLLCYLQCSRERIDHDLPDNAKWFKGAVNIILRLTKTPPPSHESFISPGLPPSRASGPVGNDVSNDSDQQVEDMITKPSSNVDPLEKWEEIYGNLQAKDELYNNLVLALPRNKRVNNVLLFGPPGTGKSMMALCAARLGDWTVFNLTHDVIMQTYPGQSEKMIKTLFKRAAECQPACIIVDEADHLFARRSANQSESGSSIRACLLAAMSRVMEDKEMRVVFIATTNVPEAFDEEFLRRFPSCIYVKLPDRGTICAILQRQLKAYELDDDVTNQRLHDLATDLVKKRTLSGYDVTRAVETELDRLLMKSWKTTKHYREETLADGQEVIVPCSSDAQDAIQCRQYRFTKDQISRMNEKKATMTDVGVVLRRTAAMSTMEMIRKYEAFNKANGMLEN